MPYEDVVLGGSRTSQFSPSVGEGHFLIYPLFLFDQNAIPPLKTNFSEFALKKLTDRMCMQ